MAVNFRSSADRTRLAHAVRRNWETAHPDRERRQRLIEIYESRPPWYRASSRDNRRNDTLVNNFVQFVRGHILTLAFGLPKWSVNARNAQGRGLDFRIETLLNRMNELLEFRSLSRSWALDSAFGYAVAKTVRGIAPKGVHSPVSPRTYRVPPNFTILDQTAQSIRECTIFGDVYLVPLKEAMAYQGFDRDLRGALTEWNESSSERMLPDDTDRFNYAEPMTRLVDLYMPTTGHIFTWPCRSDTFTEIASQPPLQGSPTPINPYSFLQFTLLPDKLGEYALLETVRPLHELSNDMLSKAAEQARMSKRNPIFRLGQDLDMDTVLRLPDNEPGGVEDPTALGVYSLPGPDPSLTSMGTLALQLFSQYSGNLEVALGQSAGADTARQTQALINQISSLQQVARTEFEYFLSDVGKKLATLAFEDEAFALDVSVPVPGTSLNVNMGWAPPHLLPRTAAIDDFTFEVTPGSTSFRTHADHLQEIERASQGILQWFSMAAQGAPIDIAAVMRTYEKAFNQIPNLREWWSGEKPTPQEQAANTYQSLVGPRGPSQREINYQGQGQGQGGSAQAQAPPPQSGLVMGQTQP